MAVFITGGHGHIGSWAAKYLAEAGEHVLIYDVNPTAPDCLKDCREQITFFQGDVMDFPRLADLCRQNRGKVQGILHTVGIMGELVLENTYRNVALNIGGTHNILEIARQFEIPRVVYTSSGAVYGAVPGIVAEDQAPLNPADIYSATKAASEMLGRQYARTYGFEFRISRVYFCYGPGKWPSRFIRLYRVAFGALEGLEGLQMDRGADQKLDFTYIEDAARGTAMLYLAENPPHAAYNIATGIPSRVGEVARLAQKFSAHPVEVALGPGTLMERCEALNIRRAREELGFAPLFTLESGMQRYADWMKRNPLT